MTHPRLITARGTRTQRRRAGVVVYVPNQRRARWVERELAGEDLIVVPCRAIGEVLSTLLDLPAPRPQILIVDFDALHPAEVFELHLIRERGWFGTIITLGKPAAALRASLGVERVFELLDDHALRTAISEMGFDAETRRIPVLHS
jgi:hypothetical protein